MGFNVRKSINFYCKSSYVLLVVAACYVGINSEKAEAVVRNTAKVSSTINAVKLPSSVGGFDSVSQGPGSVGSLSLLNISSLRSSKSSISKIPKPNTGLPASHKYGVGASDFDLNAAGSNIDPIKKYVQFTNDKGKIVTLEKGLGSRAKLLLTQDEVGVDKHINPDGSIEKYVYRSKPNWISGSDIIKAQEDKKHNNNSTLHNMFTDGIVLGSNNSVLEDKSTQTDGSNITGIKPVTSKNLQSGKDSTGVNGSTNAIFKPTNEPEKSFKSQLKVNNPLSAQEKNNVQGSTTPSDAINKTTQNNGSNITGIKPVVKPVESQKSDLVQGLTGIKGVSSSIEPEKSFKSQLKVNNPLSTQEKNDVKSNVTPSDKVHNTMLNSNKSDSNSSEKVEIVGDKSPLYDLRPKYDPITGKLIVVERVPIGNNNKGTDLKASITTQSSNKVQENKTTQTGSNVSSKTDSTNLNSKETGVDVSVNAHDDIKVQGHKTTQTDLGASNKTDFNPSEKVEIVGDRSPLYDLRPKYDPKTGKLIVVERVPIGNNNKGTDLKDSVTTQSSNKVQENKTTQTSSNVSSTIDSTKLNSKETGVDASVNTQDIIKVQGHKATQTNLEGANKTDFTKLNSKETGVDVSVNTHDDIKVQGNKTTQTDLEGQDKIDLNPLFKVEIIGDKAPLYDLRPKYDPKTGKLLSVERVPIGNNNKGTDLKASITTQSSNKVEENKTTQDVSKVQGHKDTQTNLDSLDKTGSRLNVNVAPSDDLLSKLYTSKKDIDKTKDIIIGAKEEKLEEHKNKVTPSDNLVTTLPSDDNPKKEPEKTINTDKNEPKPAEGNNLSVDLNQIQQDISKQINDVVLKPVDKDDKKPIVPSNEEIVKAKGALKPIENSSKGQSEKGGENTKNLLGNAGITGVRNNINIQSKVHMNSDDVLKTSGGKGIVVAFSKYFETKSEEASKPWVSNQSGKIKLNVKFEGKDVSSVDVDKTVTSGEGNVKKFNVDQKVLQNISNAVINAKERHEEDILNSGDMSIIQPKKSTSKDNVVPNTGMKSKLDVDKESSSNSVVQLNQLKKEVSSQKTEDLSDKKVTSSASDNVGENNPNKATPEMVINLAKSKLKEAQESGDQDKVEKIKKILSRVSSQVASNS